MSYIDRLLQSFDDDDAHREIILSARDQDEFNFVVTRQHLQKGKSFSVEAMVGLEDAIRLWIGARVLARWDQTGEPPSVLKVTVTANAQ